MYRTREIVICAVISDPYVAFVTTHLRRGNVLTSCVSDDDNLIFDDVIHVGDNEIADINGANYLGVNSFLINSNNKTIADLLK